MGKIMIVYHKVHPICIAIKRSSKTRLLFSETMPRPHHFSVRVDCSQSLKAPSTFGSATRSLWIKESGKPCSDSEITCLSYYHRFQKALFTKCFSSSLKRKVGAFKFLRFEERFRISASSETQGQLVGAGKSLKRREKNSGEEVKNALFFARIFFSPV